jgi:hypothetical protein
MGNKNNKLQASFSGWIYILLGLLVISLRYINHIQEWSIEQILGLGIGFLLVGGGIYFLLKKGGHLNK